MVISTGMVVPFISLVRSLNCITNWPMLTPCCPSAGPTGGAGVAWPPGHWSFTFAVTTLAIRLLSLRKVGTAHHAFIPSPKLKSQVVGSDHPQGDWRSDPLDLPVFEVHRGRPVEDDQHHL